MPFDESCWRHKRKPPACRLHVVPLPWPCSNAEYERRMTAAVRRVVEEGFTHVAFGDLFLEDVRRYREERLLATGLAPLFPLWKTKSTNDLAREMIDGGLEARLTCVDPRQLDASFAGRAFDAHAPRRAAGQRRRLRRKRRVPHLRVRRPDVPATRSTSSVGEVVNRDGFVFADLLLSS